MKLPTQDQYPKTIRVKNIEYKVRFFSNWKKTTNRTKDLMGECDPEAQIIRIKKGLNAAETFYTFVHELLHAIEFEYDLDIPHKLVYTLEVAIGDLFLTNF